MRFKKYLKERITNLKSNYGAGITMIDIDETVFRTFAKILIKDKISDAIIHELDNMEFNSYKLKDNEYYDFQQFRDAKLFKKTSIPIPQTIKRIKRMLQGIKKSNKNSKIIFLTARSDFDNKHEFLNTFEEHGIKMDMPTVHVIRCGNMKSGTIPERKKKIILDYLKSGEYRRVRLIDDHKPNVKALLDIENNLPKDIENAVKMRYNIPEDETFPVIQFFALWVKPDGSLQRIK